MPTIDQLVPKDPKEVYSEKHGLRWTTIRDLKKLSMQSMLTFAGINLKKLATWTWLVA
jgi:hypothetical protein